MKTLIAIQTELKAPKGQYNSFGKYHYRSCEDILEALKPLLAKHEASVTIEDELILIGDRYYVKATATFCSVSGYTRSVTAYAREEETKKGMDGSQITGASSSYARKYALNGLFLIDDTRDSDATNDHGKGSTNGAPKANDKPANNQVASSTSADLTKAIKELNDCKTYEEMVGVWNKYLSLQSSEEFKHSFIEIKKSKGITK
jgi:hypothetical protein